MDGGSRTVTASGADLNAAVQHYRDLAPRYDYFTRRINRIRQQAIDALALQRGEVVLDAGCGTGWCFPYILERIGPTGQLIAFDPSPDMLTVAKQRVQQMGVSNVTLLHATAEEVVVLPARPKAVLFSYTHDLIQAPAALDNLFAQLAPGARVAATSTKLYAPWLFPLNLYLRYTHREYITNFQNFHQPWSGLQARLKDFAVETHGFTQHYVATGRASA